MFYDRIITVMRMKDRRKIQGIMLIELLMGLAIASILAAISLPSCSYYINKYKILDLTRQLVESLYVTKQLAIVRGQVHYFNLSASIDVDESVGDGENNHDLIAISPCWVISAEQGCDCLMSISACQSNYGHTLKNVNTIAMTVNRPSLSFSPLFGMTNGATYRLSLEGFMIAVIVSSQGRIRVCMLNGESASYEAC